MPLLLQVISCADEEAKVCSASVSRFKSSAVMRQEMEASGTYGEKDLRGNV